MNGKVISLAGFLMISATGLLLSKQEASETERGEFFKLRRQAQPQSESDRPPGVDASSWVQLGPICGIAISPRENSGEPSVSLAGQITCKFHDEWHPVFLKTPPPSLTWSQ
jgi:hypothetical protein